MGRSSTESKRGMFGAPMGAEAPRSDITTPRVGPADPSTRRRMIEESIRSAAAPATPPPVTHTEAPRPTATRDLSVQTAGERIGGRQRQIDNAVEAAVRGEQPLRDTAGNVVGTIKPLTRPLER